MLIVVGRFFWSSPGSGGGRSRGAITGQGTGHEARMRTKGRAPLAPLAAGARKETPAPAPCRRCRIGSTCSNEQTCRIRRTGMADYVNLVGSRVSVMHLAYDCLGCMNTVAVSITDDRKDSAGRRRLVQQ